MTDSVQVVRDGWGLGWLLLEPYGRFCSNAELEHGIKMLQSCPKCSGFYVTEPYEGFSADRACKCVPATSEEAILRFEGEIYTTSESIWFHFRDNFAAGRDALRRAIHVMQSRLDRQTECPYHVAENSKSPNMLVEKWRNAASKERLYAAQCSDQDEKYWVVQTACVLEACANELASSAKWASIVELSELEKIP
jgi:hypothetical protein